MKVSAEVWPYADKILLFHWEQLNIMHLQWLWYKVAPTGVRSLY